MLRSRPTTFLVLRSPTPPSSSCFLSPGHDRLFSPPSITATSLRLTSSSPCSLFLLVPSLTASFPEPIATAFSWTPPASPLPSTSAVSASVCRPRFRGTKPQQLSCHRFHHSFSALCGRPESAPGTLRHPERQNSQSSVQRLVSNLHQFFFSWVPTLLPPSYKPAASRPRGKLTVPLLGFRRRRISPLEQAPSKSGAVKCTTTSLRCLYAASLWHRYPSYSSFDQFSFASVATE